MVPGSKSKYVSISVPRPLHARIKELARKKHTTIINVVEEAIGHLEILYRRPYTKSDLPLLDKVSWYIFKLVNSVGAFKENNSLDNYTKLLRTIDQIEERLLIDLSLLKHVVQKLSPEKKKTLKPKDKIELNEVTKQAVAQLIDLFIRKTAEELGLEEGEDLTIEDVP